MAAWPALLLALLPAPMHVRTGKDWPFTAAEAFPADGGVLLLVPAPVCGTRVRVLASIDGPTTAGKALPPAAGVAAAGEALGGGDAAAGVVVGRSCSSGCRRLHPHPERPRGSLLPGACAEVIMSQGFQGNQITALSYICVHGCLC